MKNRSYIFIYCVVFSVLLHFAAAAVILYSDESVAESKIEVQNLLFKITAAQSRLSERDVLKRKKPLKKGGEKRKEKTLSEESITSAVEKFTAIASQNNPPEYPFFCRKNSLEGYVLLQFKFYPGNEKPEIRVKEFSGNRLFVDAALRAAQNWNYSEIAVLINQRDMEVISYQRIIFKLN